MKEKKSSSTKQLPQIFQIFFVFLVIAAFVSQIVIEVIQLKNFYEHIPDNDALFIYWSLFSMSVVSLFFFFIAYMLNPRRKLLNLSNLFENLLLTISGVLLYATLQQITLQLDASLRFGNGSATTWVVRDAVIISICAFIYTTFLVYVRKTKRW